MFHTHIEHPRHKATKLRFPALLVFILSICLCVPAYAVPVKTGASSSKKKTGSVSSGTVMKGTWLSFIDMEELLKGKSRQEMNEAFSDICDKIVSDGGNAIFVHVRSHNDAIYPSSVYPWSEHLFDGKDPGFDILKDMTKTAHEKGLGIHAWINPYGYRNGKISDHPELVSKENIFAGVRELLKNYDIDGIHFDDYFPPLGPDNLNAMVYEVHSLCHKNGKVFGIAPQGNIQNNMAMGADIVTWLSEPGYIDYIAPQIYWTDNYGASGTKTMSTDRLKEWAALNKADIPMYVGMALYRAGNNTAGDPGWSRNTDNLARQAETAKSLGYKGYILYNTKSELMPNSAQEKELQGLRRF